MKTTALDRLVDRLQSDIEQSASDGTVPIKVIELETLLHLALEAQQNVRSDDQ